MDIAGKQAGPRSTDPVSREVLEVCGKSDVPCSPVGLDNKLRDDTLRVSESPASEDARRLLNSAAMPEFTASLSLESPDQPSHCDELSPTQRILTHEGDRFDHTDPESNTAIESDIKVSPISHKKIGEIGAPQKMQQSAPAVNTDTDQASTDFPAISSDERTRSVVSLADEDFVQPNNAVIEEDLEECSTTPTKPSSYSTTTPQPSTLLRVSTTIKHLPEGIGLSPRLIGSETPQIGTTLLRRESLRRKESPSKKANISRTPSPKKRQLKKRDTLQEREILQRFSEKSTTDLPGQGESPTISGGRSDAIASAADDSNLGRVHCSTESMPPSESEAEKTVLTLEKVISNSTSKAELGDTLEGCENAREDDRKTPTSELVLEADKKDQANNPIASRGNEDEQLLAANACGKADLSSRKTRSGTRFSDDTSMLKDFLSRAQAKKAARFTHFSPKVPKSLQESPRRSPHKTPRDQRVNASSPLQAEEPTPRRNIARIESPPAAFKLETINPDDVDEEQTTEPTSCRRSTRSRLPAPPKTVPGTPSFIPVRRADGTDPVILQKTQAQELAITTRANTRRNKGQSKPPLLALQGLAGEQDEVVSVAKQSAVSSKAVAWADKLAFYHESKEAVEEMEDQRPRMRRLRGIGAGNGTPTAKRPTAVVASSNGTPAPKRRGKHQ